ncbi:restriction endonuclease subunit S [Glaesserella parasuis]|uniref:restriction endonuclease subunit S n=1 Tax=Glaesserella parasuis TaxID=738 RepID=UPI0018C9213C|nr:restriction endonuclease subunit S [Glaesserella parasuis]QPN19880.1 restriction endonuclease subunit S [Glaesserella parasuis]
MEFKKITVGNFAENLDRFRIPLSSAEREKKRGKYPYYGAAKIIDYVDGFTHSGLSVLIAEDGSVETDKGYPVVQLANGEYWVNNHTHVLKGKNDWDTLYLYYALQIIKVSPFVTGAVQKKISQKALNSMELNYFEDPMIRRKIVESLLGLDKKIELNTQINQTLEQIAQTIFKSWFIDFDPVHAKANALASGQTLEQATQAAMAVISGKNTQELHRLQTANPEQYQQLWEIAEAFPSGFSGYKNLGEIPIGWNVLTFKDFISESKEKIGSLEDVPEYSVGNEGIYPRSEKYNKSLSKTPEKNKVVRIGDLVFGMGSKTLNWGIMNDEIGSVSPAYFVYRIFTNINYIYLNKYIKAKEYDFQNLIKPTSRQGQSVDKEMFLKKEIYVPNEYLLNIYLNKLKEIDSLVYSYTTEVLILEQIRDELLPKLLSGEI